jgi:hypothetical protein
MRRIKLFKDFVSVLNESYQDLSDYNFNNEYDKMFAEYALNERPIRLNDEDRKEASEIYGNRDVGTVWHGGKLNSEEQYNKVKNLKKGDTIKAKYMSASPDYGTAESFAMYVKSYDEMTMMWALKDAIERGSAGEYGTYVVKLKPKPEQVVFSTYGDGLTPSQSAESEVVLWGDIEVEEVKIFDRLDKENYLNQFEEMSIDSYFNDFIKRWMRSNKIERPSSEWIENNVLSKIVSKKDAVEFIKRLAEDRSEFIFNYINADEFKSNKYLSDLLNYIKFEDGIFQFDFKGDNIGISVIKDLDKLIWKERSDVLLKYFNEIKSKPFSLKMTDNSNRSFRNRPYTISDEAYKVTNIMRKLRRSGIDVPLTPTHEKFEKDFNNYLQKNIIDKTLQESSLDEVEEIKYLIMDLEYYLGGVLELIDTSKLSQALFHLYQNYAHRFRANTDEDKDKLHTYSKMLKEVLPLMVNLKK